MPRKIPRRGRSITGGLMRTAACALSLCLIAPAALAAAARPPRELQHPPMAENSARHPPPAEVEVEATGAVKGEHEIFEPLRKHPKKGKLHKPARHKKEHKKTTPAGKPVPFAQ